MPTRTASFIDMSDLLTNYRPGSAATWDEADAEIRARLCLCCGQIGHYQQQVETWIAEHGLTEGVVLADGHLHDGHHRVLAARRLGLERVPLESREDAGRRWLRDHGPVGWLGRKTGDITVSEMSWVAVDALMTLWGSSVRGPDAAPSLSAGAL